MNRLGYVFHTVKYMTARQWCYRLRSAYRKRLCKRLPRLPKSVAVSPQPYMYRAVCDPANLAIADGALRGEFPNIGDTTVSFSGAVDWRMQGNPYRLKTFKLNYFEYLYALGDAYAQTQNKAYVNAGFALIADWWAQCGSRCTGDVWDAYVVAQRLMNWIGFVSLFQDNPAATRVNAYIAVQAAYLAKNVEYQLSGNHVVMEAKALAFCGAYLRNALMRDEAITVLDKEYIAQFLPDGGHYERSPSYHVETLQHYVETGMLLYACDRERAAEWIRRLLPAFQYLRMIAMPNGRLPLVNDASDDYPMEAANFAACAGRLYEGFPYSPSGYAVRWISADWEKLPAEDYARIDSVHHTGYLVCRSRIEGEEHYLLFDAGEIGPDECPGHAHADSLNLLWSVGDTPVLIDSGIFTYQPGEERNRFRGTAAHNTVEIDGVSSSQIWAAFRVAKRAYTNVEAYAEDKEAIRYTACHDGYRKVLNGDKLTHRRSVLWNKTDGGVTVCDRLDGSIRMPHTAVCRWHIAPGLSVERVDDATYRIGQRFYIKCSAPLAQETAWVSHRFSQREETVCLYARVAFQAPTEIQTALWAERMEGEELGNG